MSLQRMVIFYTPTAQQMKAKNKFAVPIKAGMSNIT